MPVRSAGEQPEQLYWLLGFTRRLLHTRQLDPGRRLPRRLEPEQLYW